MTPVRALLMGCLVGWSFICSASGDSENQVVSETTIAHPVWQQMVETMGISENFPSLVVYGPSGRCVFRTDPELDFDASSLEPPHELPAQDCDLFISEGIGSSVPRQSDFWTIRLTLLDYEFCKACVHAEAELRTFVESNPDVWRLELTRVTAQSN